MSQQLAVSWESSARIMGAGLDERGGMGIARKAEGGAVKHARTSAGAATGERLERAEVERLVDAHLASAAPPRRHPLLVLADELIGAETTAMLQALVLEGGTMLGDLAVGRSTRAYALHIDQFNPPPVLPVFRLLPAVVQELVSSHFLDKRLNHAFLSLLTPLVFEVARDVLFEVGVENEVDAAVDQVMCQELRLVAGETVQELAHNVRHERAVVERRQIERAAERIAWTSSLRVLMGTLSTNGTGLFLQDHVHRMAVQLMAERTFNLMRELESTQRELWDSPPMHELHEMLAAGPGFESMLLELDEALAENEAHVHLNEQIEHKRDSETERIHLAHTIRVGSSKTESHRESSDCR